MGHTCDHHVQCFEIDPLIRKPYIEVKPDPGLTTWWWTLNWPYSHGNPSYLARAGLWVPWRREETRATESNAREHSSEFGREGDLGCSVGARWWLLNEYDGNIVSSGFLLDIFGSNPPQWL